MLVDLIEKGFGKDRGYNCVQKVLFGTGEIYDLKLDEEMLIPLTNTLGGGLKTGNNCGALVGGVMALGKIFPDKEYQKEVVLYFIDSYKERMGLINCKELKDKYWTETENCDKIIIEAARVLQETIEKFQKRECEK